MICKVKSKSQLFFNAIIFQSTVYQVLPKMLVNNNIDNTGQDA